MLGTNCYFVINEELKEALIVDPADFTKEMKKYVEKEELQIKAILLTHAHFDHIMGIDKIIEEYGKMPVYVGEADLELLHTPAYNESANYGRGYSYSGGDAVHDGEILSLIGYEFKVIHTPGHTAGGVCYHEEAYNLLFSGDTLFHTSIGRSDFRTSNTRALISSVRDKLFKLPDETLVCPGHMQTTKIGFEKKHNPYV